MFKKSNVYSIGLTDVNLMTYVKNQNPEVNSDDIKIHRKLQIPVIPFLQKDYGDDMDCTITSIATILYHKLVRQNSTNENFENIYAIVAKYAKKYFYNGNIGVFPLFNKKIFDAAATELNLNIASTKSGYLKNIGYSFDEICGLIRKSNPISLSMWKDGRNFYNNHTVVIIGYNIIDVGNKQMRFLMIYDNWSKTKSYIDYDKLSTISCINYAPVA